MTEGTENQENKVVVEDISIPTTENNQVSDDVEIKHDKNTLKTENASHKASPSKVIEQRITSEADLERILLRRKRIASIPMGIEFLPS